MDFCLRRMVRCEVTEVCEILKRAFCEDFRVHHTGASREEIENCMIPEFEEKYLEEEQFHSFVVVDENQRIIGCVVCEINENGENGLELLFLDPDHETYGLGARIWERIEAKYPQTRRWVTYTPYFSRRNIYFYLHKCGFSIVEIEDPRNEVWAFLKFEKKM